MHKKCVAFDQRRSHHYSIQKMRSILWKAKPLYLILKSTQKMRSIFWNGEAIILIPKINPKNAKHFQFEIHYHLFIEHFFHFFPAVVWWNGIVLSTIDTFFRLYIKTQSPPQFVYFIWSILSIIKWSIVEWHYHEIVKIFFS